MTSAQALGVGYSLWLRGKTPFIGAWVFVFLIALALHLLPVLGVPRDTYHIVPIIFVVPILLVPVIALMNALAFGPIDLNAKQSPFPLHTRLLPITTRAMVGLPMLVAVVAVVSLWLALSLLVLRPTGIATGVLWPAVTLAALVLWFQAMSWVPCPWRFVRLPLLLLSVGLPIGYITVDPRKGDYYWEHVAGMALWGILAVGVAIYGLDRARTGAALDFGASRSRKLDSAPALPAFASPFRARLWYEYRRNSSFFVKIATYFAAPLVVYAVISFVFPRAALAIWMSSRAPTPMIGLLSDIFCLFFPLMITSALGGRIGAFDFWRQDRLSPFFAIRPVSTARMVGDKLISAVIAAAVIGGWTLAVHASGYAVWFHMAPAPLRVTELAFLLEPDHILKGALLFLAFTFILWRNLVVGMWSTMTGRKWVRDLLAALSPIALFFIPAFLGWTTSHQAEREWMKSVAPTFFTALLLAKLALAGGISKRLLERNLASPNLIARVVLGWLVLVAIGTAGAARFFSFSWTAACVVALVVPLARIGVAPLALDTNRHG